MNRRILLIIVGIVILVQIIAYSLIQQINADLVNQQISKVENDIRNLNLEAAQLKNQILYVNTIIKSIPPNLLSGFEDPEKGFAEFLDYLNSPIMAEMQAQLSLVEKQKFHSSPVALHKTRFNFKFGFINTYEAERFFNFLLHQESYPVQVEELKITRSNNKANKTEVDMDVALYIPAKLKLPSNI